LHLQKILLLGFFEKKKKKLITSKLLMKASYAINFQILGNMGQQKIANLHGRTLQSLPLTRYTSKASCTAEHQEVRTEEKRTKNKD
jgi:hypothetical protein